MTRTLYRMIKIIFFLSILLVTACGLRPNDYVAPAVETFSTIRETSATPDVFIESTPSFDPDPTITEISAVPQGMYTSTAFDLTLTPMPSLILTKEDGTAQVTLNNQLDSDIYISLSGPAEAAHVIPPADSIVVEIPAGTYDYWIVIPKRETIQGVKTFISGDSVWRFYRTPTVLDSPTPLGLTAIPSP